MLLHQGVFSPKPAFSLLSDLTLSRLFSGEKAAVQWQEDLNFIMVSKYLLLIVQREMDEGFAHFRL